MAQPQTIKITDKITRSMDSYKRVRDEALLHQNVDPDDQPISFLEYSKYSLNNYTSNFISGSNNLEFKGNNLNIAGGFIKITYDTNASAPQETKQYLPGVNGTVNLYDGISTNGQLNQMEISLHYKIPYD